MWSLADAYIHRLDPVLLPISGTIAIRWYGLSYAAGFLAAFLVARALATRRLITLTPVQVADFMMFVIAGVLVGGRLGWVVFYHPAALWTFSPSLPFWEVLAINRGGMASHGGMIGVITAVVLFCRHHRISILHTLDVAALVTPFGLGFGRLANFVNSELLGKPCDPAFPLAVKFPVEIYAWSPVELRSISGVAPHIGLTTIQFETTVTRPIETNDPSALIALEQLQDQVIAAILDGSQPVIDIVAPLLTARHPSQLYQAFAEGLVLLSCLWLIFIFVKPRRPGLIGCAFLTIYGVLRIVTEMFRLPDEGIPVTMGLSRGQWLSVAMIGVGLVSAAIIRAKVGPYEVVRERPDDGVREETNDDA